MCARSLFFAVCCLIGTGQMVQSSPVIDEKTGLPLGSDLDQDAIENPREVFHSEALRGHKSYGSNLGNLAFNSPYVLGDVARKANMSCATCHVNGASNPKLFIPTLSTRHGNFDTTSALFNPKADDGVVDPLTIPSLRGARFLAPYGHDGRTASLRDFVRNVIVNEFAGTEPSAQILDAMVVYIEDIDFLPNPNLGPGGRLKLNSSASEQRGETVFFRPFPADPSMSCAACHLPSAAFADHRQHDVGSGGLFKTPTLLNANFNAPYFHDGRYDDYGQVVDYFNSNFGLGLSAQDRADLLNYLAAIGAGTHPAYHLTGVNVLADINGFASVLDLAISQGNTEVVELAVKTASRLLEDLAEHYPDAAGEGAAGRHEVALARATIAALMRVLHRVEFDVHSGRLAAAANEYLDYRKMSAAAAPVALQAADPWSLFDPPVHRLRPTDILPSQN
jgi:Di-haem cytochrome c peroxidase